MDTFAEKYLIATSIIGSVGAALILAGGTFYLGAYADTMLGRLISQITVYTVVPLLVIFGITAFSAINYLLYKKQESLRRNIFREHLKKSKFLYVLLASNIILEIPAFYALGQYQHTGDTSDVGVLFFPILFLSAYTVPLLGLGILTNFFFELGWYVKGNK